MARKPKIERFNEKVLSKFQIYNSLFLTLPFENIKETSLFLPLFAETCKKGYEDNNKPIDIVTSFFDRYAPDFDEEKQTCSLILSNISSAKWFFLTPLKMLVFLM